MKDSLLNSTWESLFKDFDIIEKIRQNGSFEIEAKSIKKYREPRLVTKFDSFEQMPSLFKENDLGIFPISRKAYIIGKYNLFCNINQNISSLNEFFQKNSFQSLDLNHIDSESEAIQIAYLNGIISDFIGEKNIVPTFFGKKGLGNFEFKVKDKYGNIYPVKVDGGMMEVDSSFESEDSFIIVEAKKTNSKNFLIRQLYYPFRYFYPKVTKTIKLIFLTHYENKFNLFEYKFNELEFYNSIELVKSKSYVLKNIDFKIKNLKDILLSSNIIEEVRIPFPQANNLKRLFEICAYLYKFPFNKNDLKIKQNFHLRQVDYYLNAGIYLNLIVKEGREYKLTLLGYELHKASLKDKYLLIYKVLCKHKIFNEIFKLFLIYGTSINKKVVEEVMEKSQLYNVKENSTKKRRSSTVYSWINEIRSCIDLNIN
jgi:hypothetical protein